MCKDRWVEGWTTGPGAGLLVRTKPHLLLLLIGYKLSFQLLVLCLPMCLSVCLLVMFDIVAFEVNVLEWQRQMI